MILKVQSAWLYELHLSDLGGPFYCRVPRWQKASHHQKKDHLHLSACLSYKSRQGSVIRASSWGHEGSTSKRHSRIEFTLFRYCYQKKLEAKLGWNLVDLQVLFATFLASWKWVFAPLSAHQTLPCALVFKSSHLKQTSHCQETLPLKKCVSGLVFILFLS